MFSVGDPPKMVFLASINVLFFSYKYLKTFEIIPICSRNYTTGEIRICF